MNVPPEARMGNDIARHIGSFWDPRMRRTLEALVAEHDDTLDPLLVEAAGLLAVQHQ